MNEVYEKKATALMVLSALFVASLTASNFLATKITAFEIAGIQLAAPAAVLAYALTFAFTDIISEVYGRKTAGRVVLAGFIAQLLVIAYILFAIKLPHAPFSPASPEAYRSVVWGGSQVIIASLIAYIISQTHDVWAFHFWRQKTGGRWLWLRNNASTMVSQLIDTVLFISLAFYVIPSLMGGNPVPLEVLASIIKGQYLVKILIALGDTPLVYLGVHLVNQYIGAGITATTTLPAESREPAAPTGFRTSL